MTISNNALSYSQVKFYYCKSLQFSQQQQLRKNAEQGEFLVITKTVCDYNFSLYI